MIRTLIKKEIHDNLLTFRFTFGTLILILLVLAITLVNIQSFKDLNQEYLSSLEKNEVDLRETWVYATLEYNTIKPPEVLSIFNLGISNRLGNSLKISLRSIPSAEKKYTQENPLLNIFPSLDLTLVYMIVISLLAMLFAFDALSGEKERGTLSLLLAQRVSRFNVILTKYLGNMATLAFSFLLSLVVAFLAIILYFPELSRIDWLRILLFALLTLFYISVFLILGMIISSLTKRSSLSLIICLFIWILFVIVFPNLATYLAAVSRTVPPEKSVEMKIREVNKQTADRLRDWENQNQASIALSGSIDGTNGIYVFTRASRETVEHFKKRIAFSEPLYKARTEQIWSVKQDFYNQLRQQEKLASLFSRFSPAGLYQEATEVISKTDILTYEKFIQQSGIHREAVYNFLESKDAFSSLRFFTVMEEKDILPQDQWRTGLRKPGGGRYRLEDFPPLDLSEFPRFRYQAIRFSETFKNILLYLISFVVINLVLFMGTVVAFNSYDVR